MNVHVGTVPCWGGQNIIRQLFSGGKYPQDVKYTVWAILLVVRLESLERYIESEHWMIQS